MRNPLSLTHFPTLLLCIAIPLYLAFRGTASLSDIAFILSSLSKRAEALYVAVTSLCTVYFIATSKDTFGASSTPMKASKSSQAGIRNASASLPNGLAHCINSFEQYPSLAKQVLERKYARYAKQTSAQKALSNRLHYPAHFEKANEGINVNARFSKNIVQIARETYDTGFQTLEDEEDAEFGVVDLAFAHLSRDWSRQGAKERQAVFPPLVDELEQHFSNDRKGKKVLVPGSGTGRLASDIADLGTSILSCSVRSMVLHQPRVRRHRQRARLRINHSLPSSHESHNLTTRARSSALRHQMDAPGKFCLSLFYRDSAGSLAQQGCQARRGRLFRDVSPRRGVRRHRHAFLHRYW
jgi:hypothetical protein